MLKHFAVYENQKETEIINPMLKLEEDAQNITDTIEFKEKTKEKQRLRIEYEKKTPEKQQSRIGLDEYLKENGYHD